MVARSARCRHRTRAARRAGGRCRGLAAARSGAAAIARDELRELRRHRCRHRGAHGVGARCSLRGRRDRPLADDPRCPVPHRRPTDPSRDHERRGRGDRSVVRLALDTSQCVPVERQVPLGRLHHLGQRRLLLRTGPHPAPHLLRRAVDVAVDQRRDRRGAVLPHRPPDGDRQRAEHGAGERDRDQRQPADLREQRRGRPAQRHADAPAALRIVATHRLVRRTGAAVADPRSAVVRDRRVRAADRRIARGAAPPRAPHPSAGGVRRDGGRRDGGGSAGHADLLHDRRPPVLPHRGPTRVRARTRRRHPTRGRRLHAVGVERCVLDAPAVGDPGLHPRGRGRCGDRGAAADLPRRVHRVPGRVGRDAPGRWCSRPIRCCTTTSAT